MLVVPVVHHVNHSLLLVFDTWDFLHIEEARLVPVELTAEPQDGEEFIFRVFNNAM